MAGLPQRGFKIADMSNGIILKTENLSRHFWGLVALSDVTFELKLGEILGVIGPNGAGKTTLINVLTGLFPPTGGSIWYEGENISLLPAHIRCRMGIARTFQISRPLADLSLLENVMTGALFGKGLTRPGAMKKALEICDFMALKDPEKPVSKLTALEIKKMEVARALSSEPKILLLDELMAGLSTDEADEIVELVRKLRSTGVSLCIIEHVMRIIATLTDRVIVLEWGRKLAEGPYAEVSQNPAVIKAYLGEDAA
jgi:branched-chain amino acid transport system ATP-binding protein